MKSPSDVAPASELAVPERDADTFQSRVQPWMMACFGPLISADRLERGDRLLEEVLELLQSGNYPRERIAALTDYVWGRPAGDPSQEVGGVQVTLAAYCLAHGLDMHEAGETELARIWTKIEAIRAKQAAKPVGSALPVAGPYPSDAYARGAADMREAVAAHFERAAAGHERFATRDADGRWTNGPAIQADADRRRAQSIRALPLTEGEK